MRGFLLIIANFLFAFTTKIKIVILAGITIMPDGVTGNTPDSGSGKSRFDP